MMKLRLSSLFLLWIFLAAASCNNASKKQMPVPTAEQLIEANRKKVSTETDIIDQFIEGSGWKMKQTDTGLRYDIYTDSIGVAIQAGDLISIDYRLYLLDGSMVENTTLSGPTTFTVEEGDVVSGLHEAVQLLSIGDSARIIIPSYLGYGLTGDGKRIPANAALLYDLAVVSHN